MTKIRTTRPSPAATEASPPGNPQRPASTPSCGVVVGVIDGNSCWVTFPENPSQQAQQAVVLKHVGEVLPGQMVLLQFLGGDPTRPVVSGVLQAAEPRAEATAAAPADPAAPPVTLEVNGQTLSLSAQQRITLRCGKASLIMHADGTIELRGTNLLSRSSGQNAIRGAAISLN